MNIGEVAELSGLPTKTIRYYEEIGLVRPMRGANGYRRFGPGEMNRLSFIGRARSLGFTIEDCRALLALREDGARASADVKALTEHHIESIDRKIAELEAMRATLRGLAGRCHGDDRPDCPILDRLAGEGAAAG
ncbi:MAG: Cu(I)-responsive transcriptional regulator [Rhodovulum sulfidophilum]|uniref:Cu(I)-responsive transcriptional regulator n=1 Tax=Rhodovulum sulfidophilum TaxID=35806 RepID=A0A2W5NH07_RHOSU|nr:MAG: Cu(I)-responsive transcriptional regulator [Rhodovulum sulfidophilum]